MGMFDSPKPFAENFQEGDTFLLEDAKPGNLLTTKHGPSRPMLLKIGGAWYSIFSVGITAQVERMENGDLPARVRVERVATKGGNEVKVLVPEGQTASGEDIPF